MANKLLIKNFPPKFSDSDKQHFLQLFGSESITCLYGKLQNCCYAEFPDTFSAKQALETMHQFEILGQMLAVEYAKPVHKELASIVEAQKTFEKTIFKVDDESKKKPSKTLRSKENDPCFPTGIAPNHGLSHNFPSHLNYKYPEPTVQILTNIANAMATVPRFYTLVLHLMNKMNLPPPFSGPTPTPHVKGDSIIVHDASVDTSDLHEFFSSDESEIETDSETKKHEIYQHSQTSSEPLRKRKRLRVVAKVNQQKLNVLNKTKSCDLPVQSAFELSSSVKRLEFKLGASIKDAVEKKSQPQINYNVFDERGEFGKIEPMNPKTVKPMLESDEEFDSEDELLDYISMKQLNENKIAKEDILAMNQFKNYKEGDQTNRLYIKNLSKQVVECDLIFIFKRFLRHCSEEEKSKLEIRLMQEGRMKGQAFVTFPNENVAKTALEAVHGYVLQEKPMVVQYGRSGK